MISKAAALRWSGPSRVCVCLGKAIAVCSYFKYIYFKLYFVHVCVCMCTKYIHEHAEIRKRHRMA